MSPSAFNRFLLVFFWKDQGEHTAGQKKTYWIPEVCLETSGTGSAAHQILMGPITSVRKRQMLQCSKVVPLMPAGLTCFLVVGMILTTGQHELYTMKLL